MSWRGRLRISNWIGGTRRYSYWQGRKGQALRKPYFGISYGYLYNWHAVNKAVEMDDVGYNIAPTDFRVPSDADWYALRDYIRGLELEDVEGVKLRSCRQVNSPLGGSCDTSEDPRWHQESSYPEWAGTDDYNFSAIPTGFRTQTGTWPFSYPKQLGRYWSTNSPPNICYWTLMPGSPYLSRGEMNRTNEGCGIRCLRDATGEEQLLDDGTYLADVQDVDENVYKTVKIGTQVWMVQNLATSKYRNGVEIDLITGNTAWADDEAGARCAMNNNEDNVFTTNEWLL